MLKALNFAWWETARALFGLAKESYRKAHELVNHVRKDRGYVIVNVHLSQLWNFVPLEVENPAGVRISGI